MPHSKGSPFILFGFLGPKRMEASIIPADIIKANMAVKMIARNSISYIIAKKVV
jgi:hypothetical protein